MNTFGHTRYRVRTFDPLWALVILAGACLLILIQ
jgi:hypothetical protein